MQRTEKIDIPVDIYNSPTEFVIVMPLGGVKKSSINLMLDNAILTITGLREGPMLKDALIPKQQACFWGSFSKKITLPANSYFNNIQSELSPENILTIIVPKVFAPEQLTVTIQ